MKKSQGSGDMGGWTTPLVDLFSYLFIFVMNLFLSLAQGLLQNFFEEKGLFRRNRLQKIPTKLLGKSRSPTETKYLGYSLSSKRGVLFTELSPSSHSALIGASRSGKTNLLNAFILNAFETQTSFALIDPKGDHQSLELVRKLAQRYQRELFIFSGSYKGAETIYLNPLLDGDVVSITDRLFNAFTWTEEHYAQQCYRGIKEAIRQLKGEGVNIDIQKVLERLQRLDGSKEQRERLKLKDGDLIGIINRLENLLDSPLGKYLVHIPGKSLTFSQVWEKNLSVVIDLPVLVYPTLCRSLGKIFLGDLFYAVGSRYQRMDLETQKKLKRFLLMVDELGSFITQDFIELLNKCLGAKMSIIMAFQTGSDIDKICPHLTEQIKINTHNWFIFNQGTDASASFFADSIGTVESKKYTHVSKDDVEQSRGSVREVREYLVHSDIFKGLNPGQCIWRSIFPKKVELLTTLYVDPKNYEDAPSPAAKHNVLPPQMSFSEAPVLSPGIALGPPVNSDKRPLFETILKNQGKEYE